MQVRIKENSWIARLAAANMNASQLAIVFGNTIHLHRVSRGEFLADSSWVCHELKHVEQYREFGFTGFISRYLLEWMRKGYYNNKFERDARDSEQDISLLEKARFS